MTPGLDADGNVMRLEHPAGRQSSQTFTAIDCLNHILESAVEQVNYDWAGSRVVKRNFSGQPAPMRLEVTYDAVKRATAWKNLSNLGADRYSFEYAFDSVHNKKYEKRTGNASLAKGDAFRYDGIYQIDGTKYGVPSADFLPTKLYSDYLTFDKEQTWTFDGAGSRKTFTDGASTTFYNTVSGTYPAPTILRTKSDGNSA